MSNSSRFFGASSSRAARAAKRSGDIVLEATDEPPPLEPKSPNKKKRKKPSSAPVKQETKSSNSDSQSKSKSQKPVYPHPDWRLHYKHIKAMRKLTTAAVDTMGCHTFMDTEISPQTARFHVFVACLLSSQTRDEITHAALGRLIALNGLTPEAICEMKEKDLADILNPVGFRNRKAGYLKAACAQFVEDGGEIPRTMEDLVALKGIGPKMANLVMTVAWGVCQGICVDIHVHRITNRLRWVKTWTKAKNEGPIKTEAALEDFIPREMWEDINGTIVGFGQTICKPVLPNCDQCTLAEICPSKKKLWKPRELRSSPKKKAKKN